MLLYVIFQFLFDFGYDSVCDALFYRFLDGRFNAIFYHALIDHVHQFHGCLPPSHISLLTKIIKQNRPILKAVYKFLTFQ